MSELDLEAVKDALIRVAATSWPRRDLDAEQLIWDAIDRIAELERQHAAAMAIVRAVAELAPGDWPVRHLELSNDLVEQAHALVAGETREEAGE